MKIINLVPFENDILFNVDSNIPAYKVDENGAMVQTEDTSFSMSYADLARQCYPLNSDIAELRSLRGQHLSGEDWIKLLTGATITVDFKFVNANDEVDGYTYENTGYIKTIKSLKLADGPAARLDRALGFQSSIVCGVHSDATDNLQGNYSDYSSSLDFSYSTAPFAVNFTFTVYNIKEPSSNGIKEPSFVMNEKKSDKQTFL